MNGADERLLRSRLLLGDEAMERISRARVIVFGVGGVGSWCAEALVRTGVRHLTIVDGDSVSPSNINRQLMATVSTVGRPKVEVLRERLLDIAPEADIEARVGLFCRETAAEFFGSEEPAGGGLVPCGYDCVVDAIDSLQDKMLLIETACKSDTFFVSSMGAALKTDPSRIQTAAFAKVHGCALARALRHRFKRAGRRPARSFTCVFSDEEGANRWEPLPAEAVADGQSPAAHGRVNGSLVHVTAVFGLTLAGLVIRHLAGG